MKLASRFLPLLFVPALLLLGADALKYQKPPKPVMDVLNAQPTPALALNPNHTYAVESQSVRYPPIAELAQPMLRLAGLRINPRNNGLHNIFYSSTIALRKIPEGTLIKIPTPPGARLSAPRWSPDATHFVFTNITNTAIELWIGDTTGQAHRIEGVRLNGVMGSAGNFGGGGGRGGFAAPPPSDLQWMPDGKTLLAETVAHHGPPPPEAIVPEGPDVQQSLGGAHGSATLEDMLRSPHDEDLFEYYATAQLALIDPATAKVTPVGKPAIFESVRISPDGKDLLVTTVHRPFSYLLSVRSFPKEIQVWDRAGRMIHKVASLPLEENLSLTGVPVGPRDVQWRPSQPATLLWVEALDRGNLKNQVPYRDHLMALAAPFTGEPHEVFKVQQRFQGIQFAAKGGMALVDDFERQKRWQRTFEVDLDKGGEPRLIWARNNQDRYKDPGRPIETTMPNGSRVLLQDGDNLFLTGVGSSPTGDHPFLDRFDLATLKSERLFHCDDDHYETVEGLLDAHGSRFLTRRESPNEPPNYYVRTEAGKMTAFTSYPDPQPSIRGIHKELVTYKRNDGVELSFTLYLPADYKPGTRLPALIWAYPYEYNDAATAGQVSGSTKRFTEITGYSELFFAMDGYAVMDNTAMPIVGDPDTVNDTYVQQITEDSQAAIDKAAAMGVVDPNRVGVGGHSYGAFMTTNLLAHTNLFKAGIAESAAENRTLTPFGFQSERRTLWEVPEVYLKMSPFMYADKIKAPLLLIHGEADDNSGTFPIQSERMYEAVRGNGGTVRLVFLPYEAHGYRGKETIEHVLWEKFQWFDKYVKGASGGAATSNYHR
ncbi:MAG TPA: prolyl oligopeptidase family serine peptidase [Bryobacteraceae bacterium]|nr:prolyl oligopeptidase family serine peptidase [Bryobacteraceae bacterium]